MGERWGKVCRYCNGDGIITDDGVDTFCLGCTNGFEASADDWPQAVEDRNREHKEWLKEQKDDRTSD